MFMLTSQKLMVAEWLYTALHAGDSGRTSASKRVQIYQLYATSYLLGIFAPRGQLYATSYLPGVFAPRGQPSFEKFMPPDHMLPAIAGAIAARD